jgi:putative transcriptional regulator
MQTVNLTNQFLIAMPTLTDPYFAKALVYVCEHNEQGALGLIVNRPLDMTLAALFEKVDLPLEAISLSGLPVYFGGPVQTDRGFVLHRPLGNWQSTLTVTEGVGLTSSRDILAGISANGAPTEILVALGYAGWSPGQLENELSQNAWLSVEASPSVVFDLPFEERLPAAMQALGISFSQLSGSIGHA